MTQLEALRILKTGANVFLTGEPGSGKTYTINEYISYLRSCGIEPSITASTGIAATHIGGMTIHSWSGIGIKTSLDMYELDKIASTEHVVKRIRKTKVLIIDEISMLTSNMLDMVDAVCREVKQNGDPFGGIQIVLVGDFFQLPPIVKKNFNESNQETFFDEPATKFAYGSSAWERAQMIVCYIHEQYRQDDDDLLSILAAIRSDDFSEEHFESITSRQVEEDPTRESVTRLFSHNVDVDRVNNIELGKLESEKKSFVSRSMGNDKLVEALKKGCLSPENLELKVGAIVMCTKNNQKEGFVNGTLGTVESFDKSTGYPIITTRNKKSIIIKPMEWTVEENGKIRAQITQIPLRLAWAMTVHKSQGMSIDAAVMDLSQVFEYGQGYVALSRVRRLSGLYLLGMNEKAFKVHPEILEKDIEFRNKSEEATLAFDAMKSDLLKTMHENFVTACGGGGKIEQ